MDAMLNPTDGFRALGPDRADQPRSPLSNKSNINATTWDRKDSSEGQPSPHESIVDAAWVSTSDLAKSPYQTARAATPTIKTLDIDLLDYDSPLSRLESPFLYGHGTELAPIREQRSISTFKTGRTAASLSTSDLSSIMHGAPGHKQENKTAPTLRRRSSFDLADLPKPLPLSRKATGEQERPKLCTLTYSRPKLIEIHAYPNKPLYPPHKRPATPPQLASHRKFYKAPARNSNPSNLSGGFKVPRFREVRSGHGNLTAHPYNRLTRAEEITRRENRRESNYNLLRRLGISPVGLDRSSNEAGPSNRSTNAVFSKGVPSTRLAEPQRAEIVNDPTIGPLSSHAHFREGSLPPSHHSEYVNPRLCKSCRRPKTETSCVRTMIGSGRGCRRGDDFCGRCVWRRLVHFWCVGS
ncbi:hypothetical protein F5Y18DRAFT_244308 [Xylariaceae sp. FL1019]|nr:hypothetical protein F5Y18DRAFT_244308 [Xylariaceae sp. FL1019]